MAANPRVAELEQKYIELLEKKIEKLESDKGSSAEPKPATSVCQCDLGRRQPVNDLGIVQERLSIFYQSCQWRYARRCWYSHFLCGRCPS